MNKGYFKTVYKAVEMVPEGNVATYGQIAEQVSSLSTSSRGEITPRIVGFALHANKDLETPCHRVVNVKGKLAENYAFGGWGEQRRRLLAERVKFIDGMHVDLKKYLWQPKAQNTRDLN